MQVRAPCLWCERRCATGPHKTTQSFRSFVGIMIVRTSFKIRSRLTYDLSVETNSLRTSANAEEFVNARFLVVGDCQYVRNTPTKEMIPTGKPVSSGGVVSCSATGALVPSTLDICSPSEATSACISKQTLVSNRRFHTPLHTRTKFLVVARLDHNTTEESTRGSRSPCGGLRACILAVPQRHHLPR